MVTRSQAYDPPEYVEWQATTAARAEWRETLSASKPRQRLHEALTPADHLLIFRGLVRFRLMDTFLKRWVKQGVISKAWLGTGEEATTVGNVYALRKGANGDVVGPMIRNAGAYAEMGMPLSAVFKSYLGTGDQLCKGRDLHIGDLKYGVIPPISMVASLVPVFSGIALAFQQRQEDRVALTWIGDGSTRTGEFHEGMSLAAALGVPMIAVVQNNQIALGTRLEVHTCADLEKIHLAYGVKGYSCDGNNVLDTYAATCLAASDCRKGRGPVIIVAKTFRMGGHATHDEAEARQLVSPALFQYWGERDPLGLYEDHLLHSDLPLEEGLNAVGATAETFTASESRTEKNRTILQALVNNVTDEMEAAASEALRSRAEQMPDGADVDHGVYADRIYADDVHADD